MKPIMIAALILALAGCSGTGAPDPGGADIVIYWCPRCEGTRIHPASLGTPGC